jgi:hypothetical protein
MSTSQQHANHALFSAQRFIADISPAFNMHEQTFQRAIVMITDHNGQVWTFISVQSYVCL